MKNYTKRQLIAVSSVYLSQILIGFTLGWSSPVIPKLQDVDKTPLSETLTDAEASLIGSALYLGGVVGPYITGYLSNVIGRKPCFLVSGVNGIFSFILLTFAQSFLLIVIARIFMGISIGILFVISFVYIGEIASTSIRGTLLTGLGVSNPIGVLIVYSIGPYVSFHTISYIGLAMSVVLTASMFTLPESPLFYILKGDQESAKAILTRLGREDDIDELIQMEDIASMKPTIKDWKEIITVRSNRKALFITLTLNILQQMSGVIAILFFATPIFTMAGSSIDPDIGTIIIGVVQFSASCVTPIFVDRVGRKILLMFSCIACGISLAILGTYFYFYENDYDVTGWQWLPLVTLMMFFIFYDTGFSIIPGTLMGEMYSPNVRSPGSTVTFTLGWLSGFGITSAFGSMIEGIGGYGTFWLFAGACAVSAVFTALFVFETKQKTLAQIQEILNK